MSYSDYSEEFILNGEIRIVKHSSNPCPVCGHPTGDCAGESATHVNIIGADLFPSLGHSDVFIVTEDVYEKRWITPFTEATVLLARAGQKITLDKAKELGLV